MKKFILSISLAFLFISCGNSNEKKVVFWVNGNCGMCKATIEKSLVVDGVYEAIWDKNTQELSVAFDSTLITLPTIATYVAKSGYDNKLVKGSDEAYEKLHECCKYERK